MCGISATINGTLCDTIKMGQEIRHRGTQHNVTDFGKIKVAFSWLPIVNEKAPMQPFTVGKWTVWMNGYISNYKELAEKYNINLYTDCDTLLLAEFINKFQLSKIDELNGFFAVVAVYDKTQVKTFTDRYGIKNLYFYEKDDTTYISSEVKGILAVVKPKLDPVAVDDWHYSLGVMTDDTIYEGIRKVYQVPFYKPEQIKISYEDAKRELKRLFDQSIRRNKTEVSNGVLLSGGVDSGIIAKHIGPDYCFSVDYLDSSFSEIENIKLNSTGKHLTIICNDQLFDEYKLKTIKALSDLKVGSCYTNFAITELASKFCKVIYSGAGGDEVFDGYTHRYDKDINSVIRRTSYAYADGFDITHKEYDWKFLRGILSIEDQIGGYHTLETRYILLDNDFVNFALSLPPEYRKDKRILKDISGLPDKIIQGKKHGFSNPHCSNAEWAEFALNETIRLYNS